MKPRLIAVTVIVVSLLVLGLTALNGPQNSELEGPTVSTSVFPLYDLVRQISGEELNVVLLLPPGVSPHTFEPSPRTIRAVNSSSAVYLIGHGVDDWAKRLADGAGAMSVTVDRNIELLQTEEEEHEQEEANEDHHGEGADPHYWLSVGNAKLIATNITEDLSKRFPEKADIFARNLDLYLDELEKTDLRIREILLQTGNRQIVTLHDAWYYFAEEYGLTIVGSFVPSPGREPTPQWLAELGSAVDRAGAQTLYAEPQISTETLEPFLRDHQLKIAILDPLGGSGKLDSYVKMMLTNAQTIAESQ